jgi:hypothetical protein
MGVLANTFGGSGQFGSGPTAVTAQGLTSEGFELTKPFIQDVLEASRAQFFQDVEDPETGETVQQLAPFEQFTGPRLAAFAPEQQEAFTGLAALGRQGLAGSELGRSTPYFQSAREATGLGSLGFTDADRRRFTEDVYRPVIDEAKREADIQFQKTVLPRLRTEAVGAGSFGGSRAALMEAEAFRNLERQKQDIEAKGQATAFEQALKAFEAQKARELQGAGLFANLGEAAPAQAARELALLSSVGEAQQAQEQAALNLAERDFIEQREFPLRQLQEFQSLVRGFPFTPSTYQVTTSQTPQPSFGQQLLGTLGTGVGIFGALGGFKNKAGGQVVPRQSGGQIRGGLASLERHQNNVNPTMGRRVTREDLQRPAPFAGIVPMMSDIVSGLFGSRQTPARMQPRFSGQRASDLPPVVRVGEAVPGSLSETSALVEAIQPKEKSISDYVNMITNQIPDRETIEAQSRILTGRTEQFTEEDDKAAGFELDKGPLLSRLGILQPPDPFESTAEETAIQNLEDAGVPNYYLDPEIGKSDSIKKQEAEAAALKDQAKEEAVKAEAAKAGGGSAPVLNPNELKRLGEGSPELSKVYSELDTAFSDYLSFLEKKKGEGAERLSEAEEAREARLFAELAATSARFAGQAGPGGFLAKLNQAALPSIAELKNIQSDFRKESRAAKDIEGDILKDKLNINLAKTKLDMERSKLESENLLRAAKAQAEGVVGGLDANEGANFVAKVSEGLTKLDPRGAAMVGERYLSNLGEGMTPRAAARNALDYADTLSRNPSLTSGARGGGPRKTASETVDDAARRNIEKVRGAGRTPVNREEPK